MLSKNHCTSIFCPANSIFSKLYVGRSSEGRWCVAATRSRGRGGAFGELCIDDFLETMSGICLTVAHSWYGIGTEGLVPTSVVHLSLIMLTLGFCTSGCQFLTSPSGVSTVGSGNTNGVVCARRMWRKWRKPFANALAIATPVRTYTYSC